MAETRTNNQLNGRDRQVECIETMIADLKITPDNFPAQGPVRDPAVMATINESVIMSGEPDTKPRLLSNG